MADVRLVLESNNETKLQPSTFHGIYTLGRLSLPSSVFHCTHPIEPGVVVRLLPHGCRVHGAGSNPAKTANKAKKPRAAWALWQSPL